MSSDRTPQKFTVLLKPILEGGYTAYCLEPPISCQGKTKEETLKKIQQAIESTGWQLKQLARSTSQSNKQKISP